MNLMPFCRRAPRADRLAQPAAALRRLRLCAALALLVTPFALHGIRPAHAGTAARGAQETHLSTPLAVNWRYSGQFYGNNPAAPVISEGVVYYASGGRVYSVDAQSGALKWQYPTDANLPTTILATPAVAGGKVILSAGDGVHALDAAKGTPVWHFELKAGAATAPAVVGDVVYFGAQNGRLYALNVETGDTVGGLWRAGIPAGDFSSDLAINGNEAYYYVSGQSVVSVTLSTGQRRWIQRLAGFARNNMAPVFRDDTLFVMAGNAYVTMRPSSGAQKWYLQLPADAAAPPAVDDNGNSYFILTNREIYAIDRNKRPLWSKAPQTDFEVMGQLALSGNLLIVGTLQGGVYAFDTATGALKWSYHIDPSSREANNVPTLTNVMSKPLISGDTMYVLTDDGALTSFSAGASDSLPPLVSEMIPVSGEIINGRPPVRFSAKVVDAGSGINPSTIVVKLDQQEIPRRPAGSANVDKFGYRYSPDDGTIEFFTVEQEAGRSNSLKDGRHTVTVTVSDWKGNVANKTWAFFVDETIRKSSQTDNGTGGPGRGRGPGSGPGGLGSGPGGGKQ